MNVKQLLSKILITPFIIYKWNKDRLKLPLTKKHYRLYKSIHHWHFISLWTFPDLINGFTYNDKIQWLKLFDQTPNHITLSDKYRVREFVKQTVGEKYLTKVYQVCKHYDEIDFINLPKKYVIKTNNDTGTIIINFLHKDHKKNKEKIQKSLKKKFGKEFGEWQYSLINPLIIIEEFIEPNKDIIPADFKFDCVNGKVVFCRYLNGRFGKLTEAVLDRSGEVQDWIFKESLERYRNFVKPKNWNEMVFVAEKLSKSYKYMRVDLYSENNKIYFGEITMFPGSGFYPEIGNFTSAQFINFDRKTFKPFILDYLISQNK